MKTISLPSGQGLPEGLGFFPDRRLPIRKKKLPSVSPVSLTSVASGWLRKSKQRALPISRETQTIYCSP